MIAEKINLQEFYPCLKHPGVIDVYAPDNFEEFSVGAKRRAIILFPGGGYCFVSKREGEPVALNLLAHDFVVFVLDYFTGDFEFPYPLIQAIATLDFIYKHADKFHVDINHISVMGFSAGGHLAASLGAYYKNQDFANLLNIDSSSFLIEHLVLCYPVITMDENITHSITKTKVTQSKPELVDFFSIEKHVTKDFPKCYIWITSQDSCVNNLNVLVLADSLRKAGVLYELHIFPFGDHGQSLANDMVYYSNDEKFLNSIEYNSKWLEEAIHFIKKY